MTATSCKPLKTSVPAFYLSSLTLILLSACAPYKYEAKPIQTEQNVEHYLMRDLGATELRAYLDTYQYETGQWPLSSWDLEGLTLAAYYFNTDLQVALAELHKAQVHLGEVNPPINPDVQIPLEHHSDTGGGRSPWLFGLLVDFVLEREARRQARYDQASAEERVARVHVNQSAWSVFDNVRRSYADFCSNQRSRNYLRERADITAEIMKQVERRYELGQASEFEISSVRLELQRQLLALNKSAIELADSQSRLATAMGIPANKLQAVNYSYDELDDYLVEVEQDQDKLREIALTHRLDILQALAEYDAQEAAVRLEVEKQYPDITLSTGFIFDQEDRIWALGASWIVPLLAPQNKGAIMEALAEREIKQARFLSLQVHVINEVTAAVQHFEAQRAAFMQADELLKEVRARTAQMQKQYELGYADRLQLSRSKLELLTMQQTRSDLQTAVIVAAGKLEDSLHYPLFNRDVREYQFHPDKIQD